MSFDLQSSQRLLERKAGFDAVPEVWDHCGMVVDRAGDRAEGQSMALIWAASEQHAKVVKLLYSHDPASAQKKLRTGQRSENEFGSIMGAAFMLVSDLLPYLIRGEGEQFTQMVEDMLEEARSVLALFPQPPSASFDAWQWELGGKETSHRLGESEKAGG